MRRLLSCIALFLFATAPGPATAQAQEAGVPPALLEQLRKADRILLATPEGDVEAKPGKGFLVEVEAAFRGSGNQGSRARLTNAGDGGRAAAFKGGKRYVFLLVKGPGGRGWSTLGSDVLAVDGDQVTWMSAGGKKEAFPLATLEDEIEKSVPTAPSQIAVRETLSGRWLICWSERGTETIAWLVEFEPGDAGTASVKLLEGALESTLLRSAKIAEGNVSLDLVANGMDFLFRGKFQDGRLRGTMNAGNRAVVPAWFVPTELQSLAKSREPRPVPGHAEYLDAVSSDTPLISLQRVARRFKGEPIALDAFANGLAFAVNGSLPEDRFREFAEAFIAEAAGWGPLLKAKAEVDLALSVARADRFHDLGLELAKRAQEEFTAETPPQWAQIIRRITGQLLIGTGRDEEGIAHLKKVRAESAFDPEITWLLAQQSLQREQLEDALEMFSELVVLPGLEGAILSVVAREYVARGERPPASIVPSRLVEKIWGLLKRPEGELIPYLDELYERKVAVLAEGTRAPRGPGEGNRVMLCELFTGAQCPPCIAADVATTALEKRYARSEVIVLRYHQHIPGPDPLANPETLSRFEYYHGDSTPALFINGRSVLGIGGMLPAAQDLYQRLQAGLESTLDEQIDLGLDLAAKVVGESVELTARARGLSEFPQELRLRLVLAEERIAMPARNGIRVHHMIARTMPGGVAGIAPQDGQLAFQGTVDIGKFRKRIADYLELVEKESEESFDRKPMDFRKLVLVAWLQNDESGEVIQAASIPVTGELNFEPLPGKARAGGAADSKARGKKK